MDKIMNVSEAARELRRSEKWLRNAERAGKIPKARRDLNGWRVYTPDDIANLQELISGSRKTTEAGNTIKSLYEENYKKLSENQVMSRLTDTKDRKFDPEQGEVTRNGYRHCLNNENFWCSYSRDHSFEKCSFESGECQFACSDMT